MSELKRPSGKIELGQVVATRGVADMMKKRNAFKNFVYISLGRYKSLDWGDTCKEDKAQNDYAVKNGDRVLAVYKDENIDTTIWIVTEWDRRVTTILFPDEY